MQGRHDMVLLDAIGIGDARSRILMTLKAWTERHTSKRNNILDGYHSLVMYVNTVMNYNEPIRKCRRRHPQYLPVSQNKADY